MHLILIFENNCDTWDSSGCLVLFELLLWAPCGKHIESKNEADTRPADERLLLLSMREARESQRPWTSGGEHTESRALTKAPWW